MKSTSDNKSKVIKLASKSNFKFFKLIENRVADELRVEKKNVFVIMKLKKKKKKKI